MIIDYRTPDGVWRLTLRKRKGGVVRGALYCLEDRIWRRRRPVYTYDSASAPAVDAMLRETLAEAEQRYQEALREQQTRP
jgi:hypothetical protein